MERETGNWLKEQKPVLWVDRLVAESGCKVVAKTYPLPHGSLRTWLSLKPLCGREKLSQPQIWNSRNSPEPPTRGRINTHFFALLSWESRRSFGSSGAGGALSNKTGSQSGA